MDWAPHIDLRDSKILAAARDVFVTRSAAAWILGIAMVHGHEALVIK
jgi:hypothetical protein